MARKFNIDKGSTSHNSHMYSIYIENQSIYEKNKNKILLLIKDSIDMAQNEWENRLKIENGPKKLKAKGISIDNNLEEYSKLALMYLDPDYKYDVGK